MSKPFIVTGGAGFIGSNVVAALNARGVTDILVVDELDSDIKKGYLADLEFAEYLDKTEFRTRFREKDLPSAEAVFHLGACSSTTETNAAYLEDNNTRYTQELCQWCLEQGARFIYASSAATYGDGSRGYVDADAVTPALEPLNLYGKSKQDFDVWALQEGVLDRIAGLKYFNVYGPREDHKGDMRSLVNKSYEQILETGKIKLFKSYRPEYRDGEQVRDFIYVRDAVAVTLWLYDHSEVSGLFNCGTGRARSWVDLATALFAAMGREPDIEFIEMPEFLKDRYQYHTQADMAKLRGAGYDAAFMSIEEGVGDYVESWLRNGPQTTDHGPRE